ncbi:MAG: hypothetical protein E6G48_07800, partial [Actinobacteria bacterium]
MAHQVTLIPGDGTGPEIAEATRRVLEATGVGFEWDVRRAGLEIVPSAGTPLPPDVIYSIRANRVALKGPITTPVAGGFRSVNVALRMELDLYACLRPCKWYRGARSRYEDVDIVVVRENTEDLYAQSVPGPDPGVDQAQRRGDQGADHDPGRLGLPLDQRPAAQGARPVRLYPAVQALRRGAFALRQGRHRDRPREHRGSLRRDRVRGRLRRRREAARVRLVVGCRDHPRALRDLDQADLGVRLGANRRGGVRLRQAQWPSQGDGGAQGQHHEVLRRPVPRHRPQGG